MNSVKEQQLTGGGPANEPPLKNVIDSEARKLLSAVAVTVRVTFIFILAILADYLIIKVISWTFGNAVNSNQFAADLLEGIQLLSAIGTALAYILYLIRALFKDLKETRDEIKEK
jgi:TRAP-type C4-dicarboxylate transport system permease small subunit